MIKSSHLFACKYPDKDFSLCRDIYIYKYKLFINNNMGKYLKLFETHSDYEEARQN